MEEEKAAAQTWSDLAILQAETESILASVRRKGAQKKGSAEHKGTKGGNQGKGGVGANGRVAETKKVPAKISRLTVEILDEGTMDMTPRGDDDEKVRMARLKALSDDLAKLNQLKAREMDLQKLPFEQERTRVVRNGDIFVSAPNVPETAVYEERERLAMLEASARKLHEKQSKESTKRRKNVRQELAAVKMQSLFRGFVGRQKFKLSKRLRDMKQDDSIWIEVRDSTSGDVWYYNRQTGRSQWDRPAELFGSIAKDGSSKRKLDLGKTEQLSYASSGKGGMGQSQSQSQSHSKSKSQTLQVSMSLPSSHATKLAKRHEKPAFDAEAWKEVDAVTGADKISLPENLFLPDGSRKPLLRNTIVDSLVQSRFDSISSVLADDRWMDQDKAVFEKTANQGSHGSGPGASTDIGSTTTKLYGDSMDPRRALVSISKLDKPSKMGKIGTKGPHLEGPREGDLTMLDVDHPGLTRVGLEGDGNPFRDQNTMCFGCWSAGASRKCTMHHDGTALKPSQTMLLCRNWELGVMRRRYRSEEIQEIFMKRVSSLRYDVKRKQFLTVVEQRHQIYRGLKSLVELFNFRMLMWMKIKRWLNSLADEVRIKPTTGAAQERVKMMRLRRTLVHSMQVNTYLREIAELLPLPPITGSSWPERIGDIRYLVRRADQASGREVELILAYPTPPCETLYKPREYHIPVPRSIPMPVPAYHEHGDMEILPATKYINELNKAAWLERMAVNVASSALSAGLDQISAVTPVAGIELVRRTKQPAPCTIKFATMGRKPEPGNLCVGGLAVELLLYQLISTYIPPQYGNFMVMDKATISPGVSPEIIISFQSLPSEPIPQEYVTRHLEHPLNYRRAPTITANSAADPDNKHYYGTNRPEQTGEREPFGFRTTSWARNLVTHELTDPSTFTPGPEVVSLNVPASNRSVTTRADHTYPFCEPSTRDNSSLDFFHLLLQGCISGSKSQVFTALTVQEPGLFLRECRDDLPLGHLVVSVYRSWAFTQRDTIEEFKTDDGISYWYHRRTGQTFWERPLAEDEEPTPLLGGTIIDQVHPEEPLTVHKGQEGAERRYLQGDFRKQMLAHHETTEEAEKRRQKAVGSVKVARDRGVLPSLPPGVQEAMDAAKAAQEAEEAAIEATNMFAAQMKTGASGGPQRMQIETGGGGGGGGGPSSPSAKAGSGAGGGTDDPGAAARAAAIAQFASKKAQSALPNGGPSGVPGLNMNTLQGLQAGLGQLLNSLGMMESASPQEIIQMGMGMGMTLLQNESIQSIVGALTNPGGASGGQGSPTAGRVRGMMGAAPGGIVDMQAQFFPAMSEEAMLAEMAEQATRPPEGGLPVGRPNATVAYSSSKNLDAVEMQQQKQDFRSQLDEPLTAVQHARSLKVQQPDPSETPDEAPVKVLSVEMPLNAEMAAKAKVPILAYPELSSWPKDENGKPIGPPATVSLHPAAGEGTSFVTAANANKILKVEGSDILRKSVAPLPIGFFNAIVAKHIAKQAVDYLPMVPNLPQSRTVGRVKPRSSAIDWMAISFDPWSAGKNPLNSDFVPSLAAKAEKIFGGGAAAAQDALDALRETNKDAFIGVEDKEGMADIRAEVTKGQLLAQDFAKVCSLCRHSKFADVESMVNQPDWNVPVDYQDDMGNSLLHVVCQNGNRRLVKLCMRRGADLNIRNLNGQTPLHFAFGYGYTELGEYLVHKGADDSICNKDGLTPYEGLGERELSLL